MNGNGDDKLLEFLYGELSQSEAAEMDIAIKNDPALRAKFEAAKKMLSAYRSQPVALPPSGAAAKALAAAGRGRTRDENSTIPKSVQTPIDLPQRRFVFHPAWGMAALFMVVVTIVVMLPDADTSRQRMQEQMEATVADVSNNQARRDVSPAKESGKATAGLGRAPGAPADSPTTASLDSVEDTVTRPQAKTESIAPVMPTATPEPMSDHEVEQEILELEEKRDTGVDRLEAKELTLPFIGNDQDVVEKPKSGAAGDEDAAVGHALDQRAPVERQQQEGVTTERNDQLDTYASDAFNDQVMPETRERGEAAEKLSSPPVSPPETERAAERPSSTSESLTTDTKNRRLAPQPDTVPPAVESLAVTESASRRGLVMPEQASLDKRAEEREFVMREPQAPRREKALKKQRLETDEAMNWNRSKAAESEGVRLRSSTLRATEADGEDRPGEVASMPPHPLLVKAEGLYLDGKYAEAISVLEQFIQTAGEKHADVPEARAVKARCHAALGQADKAAQEIAKLNVSHPHLAARLQGELIPAPAVQAGEAAAEADIKTDSQ